MESIYTHYGHSYFDSQTFIDVKMNPESLCDGRKPRHGLWGSPNNTIYGWKKVINSDEIIRKNEKWRLEKYFEFKLSNSAKILLLNNEEDFCNLLQPYAFEKQIDVNRKHCIIYKVDWKKVAEDYDAIVAFAGSNNILNMALGGWDCDSICVFHKEILLVI